MHIKIKRVLNSRASKGHTINGGNIVAKATTATGHKRITKRAVDSGVIYLSEPEGVVGHQFKVDEHLKGAHNP